MKDIKEILSSDIHHEIRALEFLGFEKTAERKDCIHGLSKANDTHFTTYTRKLLFSQDLEITFLKDLRRKRKNEKTETLFFSGDRDHPVALKTFADVQEFINDTNRLKKWLKQ